MSSFVQDLHPWEPRHLFMIIMKSVTMMLGELDYDHTYVDNGDEQHFSNINLLILLLFAIIMPILLMNLLVGLAIGDLMQIQQNARLKRLAMQVGSLQSGNFLWEDPLWCPLEGQLHTNLEKKFPTKLLKRWSKNELIIRPNPDLGRQTISIIAGVSSP